MSLRARAVTANSGNGGSGSGLNLGDAGQQGEDGGAEDIPEAGPGCGDGKVNQPDEECDDGNTLPGDGCSGACTQEDYSVCPPGGGECMSTIKCGDGVVEASEACDDGNDQDGDGCSADCLVKDPLYDCAMVNQACVNTVVCGDSQVTGDEVCDDANKVERRWLLGRLPDRRAQFHLRQAGQAVLPQGHHSGVRRRFTRPG